MLNLHTAALPQPGSSEFLSLKITLNKNFTFAILIFYVANFHFQRQAMRLLTVLLPKNEEEVGFLNDSTTVLKPQKFFLAK